MLEVKTIKAWIPAIFLAIIAFSLSILTFWIGDDIAYRYIMLPNGEEGRAIGDLGDIILSQTNHYFAHNGRFFCHVLVQLFCGIAGKTCFSILNAFIYLFFPLILIKLSGREYNFKTSAATALLILILIFPLEMRPSLQINYMWMGLMNLVWLYWFFRNDHKKSGGISVLCRLLVIFICSFITGESHELIAAPVGGALLIYAITKGFRFSLSQWMAGLAYVCGALILMLAPGNFHRLSETTAHSGIAFIIENILPALIIPLIFIITAILTPIRKIRKIEMPLKFWILAVLIGFIFCLLMKFSSGSRMLIFINMFLIIAISALLRKGYFSNLPAICITVIAASLLVFKVSDIYMKAEKYSMIQTGYLNSKDGITVIPDRYYFYDMRPMNDRKECWTRRDDGTSGKPITILPESIAKMRTTDNLKKYKNILLKISDQAWFIKLSKTDPAQYKIRKWLKPEFLGKELQPRIIDPEENKDIIISSTPESVSMIYFNERPYIHAEIECIPR